MTHSVHDNQTPVFAVPDENLIPVSNFPSKMTAIPPSRMFLINKALKIFKDQNPNSEVFDASQGDGGASLPGVTPELLLKAARMQVDHGTAYDMPYGTDQYRKIVFEKYWQINSSLDLNPKNILATVGGRDGLIKAYQAMLGLGYGRFGDVLVVSRVPWISYNWGPYGIGANVLWAPGDPDQGWAYSEDTIKECVKYSRRFSREVAGIVITSPDNPTGLTLTPTRQIELAKAALEFGVGFVLFDWMYHFVTDQEPMNLNDFISKFDLSERKKLIFMDGITKSLGASNIRNCHLIASEEIINYIVARASHGVIPPFYSLAVAIAAYEMGYAEAAKSIVEPTNKSRIVLKNHLEKKGYKYILGKGYYAFINVNKWLKYKGWVDSEPMGQYFAENLGLAIVPGAFFSPYGSDWIRFSYATPPEITQEALWRLDLGLESLEEK